MKTVLVTGGSGFTAHHVIDYILNTTDYKIVTLDRIGEAGNLNRLAEIKASEAIRSGKKQSHLRTVFHDLRSPINAQVSKMIGEVDIILHLAASSHVTRSIENPVYFVESNVTGTVNLLEYARTLPKLERMIYFSTDEVFGPSAKGQEAFTEYDRYNSCNPYSASKAAAEEMCVAYQNTYDLPIYITHCHDEETMCWTENGFKSVADLTIGENVWVLKDNRELALEPILEIVNSPYVGDMISFKSQKYDLNVTPNHRMLQKKDKKGLNKEWHIDTAENMFNSKGRQYIPNTGVWNGKEVTSFDINNYIDTSNSHFNEIDIPITYNMKNFVEFLGWFLSEGYVRSSGGEVGVYQKKYNNDGILECMQNLGYNVHVDENKEGVMGYKIHSVKFAKFMAEQFGIGAHNKKIPMWIKSLNISYLKILFDSMMLGDGSIRHGYTRYYTSSAILAEDMCEIGIKLGYTASIKTRSTKHPTKDIVLKSFYVSFSKANGTVEKNNMNKTQYNGNIWCVRTNSGNFFVKRNGVVSCSGNTMNIYGERQAPEKYVPMSIKKILNGEMNHIHYDTKSGKYGSRSYLHAKDVAEALMFILAQPTLKSSSNSGHKVVKINISSGKMYDNMTIANIIAKALGKDLLYEAVDPNILRPGHDFNYNISGEYLNSIGWNPSISVEERLPEVAKWFAAHSEWLN